MQSVKHQPATPLPWARCVRSPKSVTGNMNAGATPSKVAHVNAVDDRAYIEHAANAYPKLVAALQDALAIMPPESAFISPTVALLRELGEA